MTLPRSIRLGTALALATGALAFGASSASAGILTPPITDFGSHKVGTKSATKTVTLTAQCVVDMGFCISPDRIDTTNMNVSGPFQIAKEDCPPTLIGSSPGAPASCRIDIAFTPKVADPAAGTLTVESLSAQVKGTGTSSSKKKCKKKKQKGKSAAAAKKKKKKCKRKKKK
jgi:hypothetical protein